MTSTLTETTSGTFTALVIDEVDGTPSASFRELTFEDLPDHDVLVEVEYSSLNYKDGLAVSGRQRIARCCPLVAGADLAGVVVESRDPAWRSGDRVVVNGWGMSETQAGGYTRYQRVDPSWLVRLPDAFTTEQAMAIGTAGYTAALCVDQLERWGVTAPATVLVTGAGGGVGSVAVALLAAAGFDVAVSTGRPELHDYLSRLGASDLLDRGDLIEPGRPLQPERWHGAIDSVGGATLANVLASTRYGGAVAACGLAGGPELPGATVLPHILRGVALLGVDSVMAPHPVREAAWRRLARDLRPDLLAEMATVEPMSELPALADAILAGRIRGRVVIDVRR
jgi:acrylyl-CoA reductase (NADPH)